MHAFKAFDSFQINPGGVENPAGLLGRTKLETFERTHAPAGCVRTLAASRPSLIVTLTDWLPARTGHK